MSSRSKSLFAVYCDEPAEDTTRVSQSTSAPRRVPSKASSTVSARPVKKALANKENNPSAGRPVDLKSAKSSADAAAKVFGTKQPFSEASPIKSHSIEEKEQSLGYYGAGQTGLKKKNTSQGQGRRVGGFTVLSSSSAATAGGLRGGDPVKRSTSSKTGKTSSWLGESRLRQRAPGRLHHQPQPQDATFTHQQSDEDSHSPALANISEAFSGQGGFHWSPSSAPHAQSYATQAQETELDTPQGPLRVLNDAATHPSYADSPLDDTVIFRGSPIKRSRQNNQPAIEQRLRALRL